VWHSASPRAPVTSRILDLNSERDDLRGKGELQGPAPRKREARALGDTWVRELSFLTFQIGSNLHPHHKIPSGNIDRHWAEEGKRSRARNREAGGRSHKETPPVTGCHNLELATVYPSTFCCRARFQTLTDAFLYPMQLLARLEVVQVKTLQ
jgi:hypothetical protein